MPVLDTEVLFALNPGDKHHKHALKLLSELREKGVRLHAPDTALMEFQIVLRSISKEPAKIRKAVLALRTALQINGATETSTVDSQLVARQCEIEEKYDLSFFDSLIAASALRLDLGILSDDRAFDRIPSIVRTPMS